MSSSCIGTMATLIIDASPRKMCSRKECHATCQQVDPKYACSVLRTSCCTKCRMLHCSELQFNCTYCCTHCTYVAGCKEEQAAARVLGYTQASWDNDSRQEKQPASSNKYWNQLTHDERAAAAVLGYSELTWDKLPAAMHKTWSQLLEHERAAARVLGYAASSWDNTSRQRRKPISMAKGWAQLTLHERAAAALLGYTEEAWDGTTPQPTAAQKTWSELTSCG